MAKVIMINTKTRTVRVENADKNIDWITIKGTHIPIEKGQSKSSAVQKFVESKRGESKQGSYTKIPKGASQIGPVPDNVAERHIKTVKEQQPAKPHWDGGKKTPYKDASTLYEFLKKNDYTYPDMDKYKSYTWEQFLDDAHKGTVPKPFAKADTAQVDKLYDYAFHKTGKNQDEFADWVKKSVTWHGDSNKPERNWYRGKDEDEDAYYARRDKTLAEARKLDKVSDWYGKAYKGDSFGKPKNKDLTFKELADGLLSGKIGDFYEAVGTSESDVREKIFQELSERTGRPYDDFYDAWLHGGKPGTASRKAKAIEDYKKYNKMLDQPLSPDVKKLVMAARDRAKKEAGEIKETDQEIAHRLTRDYPETFGFDD